MYVHIAAVYKYETNAQEIIFVYTVYGNDIM